jgi:truncated hemoglobin YjbI|tara:strand:+ start:156 stop:311 length:156 start_codon:yes stop_codon:yes gene_type:complete
MANDYNKMTAHEFVQWLKGYLEAIDATNITYKEYEKILERIHSVKPKDEEL